MKVIKLENIKKTYRIGTVEINALAGVSISISDGEFVAIMGPSGSGKSTLMHILGCLDSPSEGKYFLENKEVSELKSDELANIRNKEFGFVFQAYNLINQLNALENVMLPVYYSRNHTKDPKKRAEELLETIGLKDRMKNRPLELSGGEQQRVAIARALMMNPDMILADEPTGNLNSQSAFEIISIFKNLNSQGKTIIYVTHDDKIGAEAQRIIKIKDGLVSEDISGELI